MSVTAGALSLVYKTSDKVEASSAAATGGTGPYTYQWYMSTTTGFTPGAGNILTGQTALTLTETGLLPNTAYYFKVVATDTGDSNTTSTSSQLAVTTVSAQSQNQFAQSTIIGFVDMPFNFNTFSAQVDVSQTLEDVRPGDPLKMVNSAGGVPKLIKLAAATNIPWAIANYNIKNPSFPAGAPLEVSASGNVMWMVATAAISRQSKVCPVLTQSGGVVAATGSSALAIIGVALDKASAAGDLIRVQIDLGALDS